MSGQSDEDDDSHAFRTAMAGVRKRSGSNRVQARKTPPPPHPRSREADDRAVLEELRNAPLDFESMEAGDALSYRGEGLQDAAWRRLRRGGYRIGAELDLHGLNRDKSHLAVVDFLAGCHDRNVRCVRIIHGKGLRSPNSGPVIKALLDSWLRRRRDVLAFCSARPHDGGTGAVYVLLKSGGLRSAAR